MSGFEVANPILNGPFDEPTSHWWLQEGKLADQRPGRRPAMYWWKPPGHAGSNEDASTRESPGTLIELKLVNLIRERVKAWRTEALRGGGGVTRTTCELLNYWRRAGRERRLFFAQLEAVETIIFLNEARGDFLQGIDIPSDEPSEKQKTEDGYRAFRRYACKMATGSGKTTVMAMLAAWSILNKVNDRGDARFSDTVLVVCPNVTIRNRLRELDPTAGDASLYRTRDLVPPDGRWMADLNKGRVLVTNWHVFEPQAVQVGGTSARVSRAGKRVERVETIIVAAKTTTARGSRYMTPEALSAAVARGEVEVLSEERDDAGNLSKVKIRSHDYVESDTALVNRVLGREVGGKQNILVFNDEAHHAYRIRKEEPDEEEEDLFGEEEEIEEFFKEATVWIDGLDKVHKLRGVNFCVDLSATPYYLGRVGQDTNRTFPWVVSDFSLTDAIESGLVKIPQLAVRDTTGAEIPGYFNIWRWILPRLTPAERGGRRGNPKPEAILKWAHTPIAMLGGLWEQEAAEWSKDDEKKGRWPVFIVVCKNTKIAKVVYEWLAEDNPPAGIPSALVSGIKGFLNRDGRTNTIRVDTKVVHETDSDYAKADESAWMRFTLDTVGKLEWPKDRQGRFIYPDGFEALAEKLKRPIHPPGRDVRCIVSVGMLTEGWDCNTVTHIIGLRPFMSQLLCEQVVGRGLRRASYDLGEDGKLTEEVAKILGVPFEVIPFKENKAGPAKPREKRHHVHAVPQKAEFEIKVPRVEGYTQAIRNRVTVDWDSLAPLRLDPMSIPPEIQMKGMLPTNRGRPTLLGPGRLEDVTLNPYRQGRRLQELAFELARDLVRGYCAQPLCEVPAHVLFPQVQRIVHEYLRDRVVPVVPAEVVDVFLSPYYGWVYERLVEAIRPDAAGGEAPEVPQYERNREAGSTGDVSFWTSRDVREVVKSHLNYVVADTKRWEQSAAYRIDRHPRVLSFVKNDHLGFAIPYLHNGQPHDYVPDFVVRLARNGTRDSLNLILETKGFDPLKEIKKQAAERWVSAVNADGTHGRWAFRMADSMDAVEAILGNTD